MSNFLKYGLYFVIFKSIFFSVIYVCDKVKFYPVDFLPRRSVSFKINSLYGQPVDGISEFHVSTNIGDFQNRDSLVNFKFNSRDIKAYLSQSYRDKTQGTCYAFVNGYRGYYPPQIPNILSIKCH